MKTSRLSREVGRVTTALRSESRRAGLRSRTAEPHKVKDAADLEDAISPSSMTKSRKRKRNAESAGADASAIDYLSIVGDGSVEVANDEYEIGQSSNPPIKTKRPGRHPAKQEMDQHGEVVIHPPSNWDEMYRLTAQMRKLNPAPVDTMGCETLAEEGLSERDRRFQTLIALMLSSQTKDTVTAMTMRRLQTELPRPGLTLERILEVKPEYLNELIWQAGFHNNKTKFIKATAEIIKDNHGGDIPDTIEGLTSLPGVGPKMAYLCMSAAWGRDEGIGVDVHVHRITNLWGWHKTKTPEETRAMLEAWLPKEKWHDINHLLVGFGQTICLPIGRKCGDCTLSDFGLCPSAVVDRKTKARKLHIRNQGMIKQEMIEEDSTVDGGRTFSKAVI